MRRIAESLSLAVLILIAAACEPVSLPTTTTSDILAPPDGIGGDSGPSTTSKAPPPTVDPSPYNYEGSLPDGTPFHVTVPGERQEQMLLVAGDFSYRFDEDTNVPVGEVRYVPTSGDEQVGYSDGTLVLQSGGWLVEVFFSPEVLDALGENPVEVITRSVGLEVRGGLPVLGLTEPFTWVGGSAQIRYETFVVASGCHETAVRCSDNRAVQVLNVEGFGLSDDRIDALDIETSAHRPIQDPFYLNPGPLSERLSADLIWTGEEVIVWGGKTDRDGVPDLTDGAAFDPASNRWRMLPPIPGVEDPVTSRAVWADDEMTVVSLAGTFAYDPVSDSWRDVGPGGMAPEYEDRMLHADGNVYVWATPGTIDVLSLATGVWETIDPPDDSSMYPDAYFGVLRSVGDRVVAVTLRGSGCSGKSFWELSDGAWEPLPEVSLGTTTYADCSAANQTAAVGGSLVIWDEENHPSALLAPGASSWTDLPPVPLGGTEGPPGPVAMGPGHFLVPRWGEAAIFSLDSREWVRVELPGQGTGAEIIWTGEELFAWGVWETFDAWRWAPPDGLLLGDDAG